MQVLSVYKKVAAFVLFSFVSVLAAAQTDDDIAVFLENVSNEIPKTEEMDFYLVAGRRLLREGRMEEADVFFDFAASLGSEEGFMGKAATSKNNSRKEFYQAFSERKPRFPFAMVKNELSIR